ncbi:tripartite tricarboxylate transporter substrate binding protein [Geminicoccaceae bacterium 1502E]|nr:tripartite tricarboxylate transporter substrate binding protein [Geminicoccaceae bacterium 1502E]
MRHLKGKLTGLAIAAAVSCQLAMAGGAAAQTQWPSQPVKVIVPYSAGGGSDAMARIFQRAAGEDALLDAPLVIQNVGGAGGRTGSRQAMDAEPDGYTFLSNHLTLMTGEATGVADFGYRDFEPVAATGAVCMVVAVPAASPYGTLEELLAAAVDERLVYGANLGALNHMAGIALQNTQEGARFNFVQIGGDTENLVALMGNVTQAGGMSTAQYRASEGSEVRGLAVLADEREPSLPDLPTAAEQGFDADFCFEYWWFAPKGTPQAAIDGMADFLQAAMDSPAVKKVLAERSVRPVFRRGEEFKRFLDAQWERIVPLAQQATGG